VRRPNHDRDGDAPSIVAPPPPPGGYAPAPSGIGPATSAAPDQPAEPPSGQWLWAGVLLAVIALIVAKTGWWGLLVLVGLILMIFLHELGHFLMAKRAGMKVTEFFLGFGPRLVSFRRGETEYGIKAIWVGAYVKIVGMNNLDEVAPEDEPRAYRQGKFRDRLGVAVAGSAMHFLQALVLVFVLLTMVGVQGGSLFGSAGAVKNWSVDTVSSGSAAAAAGLRPGDRIQSVAGVSVRDFDALREAVAAHPDQKVTIVYSHKGATERATVQLGHQPDDPSEGLLGITPQLPTERVGVVDAVPQTFRDVGTVANQSVRGLADLVSPTGISGFFHQLTHTSHDEAGPTVTSNSNHTSQSSSSSSSSASDDRPLSILGVFQITTSAAQADGITAVLSLFVLINVFIGLFNLIPLLPFDGGHVVVAVYEKVQEMRRGQRRYFADVSRLLPVTYVVVVLLAGLFASTLYLDIVNPVSIK
jgi:membrane-associated protease RseP (regulator of RpoE activity)